jgi:NADPH-dependent curcumin reductase
MIATIILRIRKNKMTAAVNTRIVLASRPVGEPVAENFDLQICPVPEIGEGEILCRTLYLSLDPYMRGRMNDAKSYAEPVALGEVMTGGTVSEVLASNVDGFAPRDIVTGYGGWQAYSVATQKSDLRRLDPSIAPISTALGILGMPGMTAYTGLLNIGQPKPGETVVVAAAAGPVGSLVGQIAKLKGCLAVGIAGSPEKCRYVIEELGFDACINHREENLYACLKDACPDGVDVYFENVGGKVLESVIGLMNPFSRMPVCGLVSQYNMTELPMGQNMLPALMRRILTNRITIRGFIVWDFADQEQDFLTEVSGWLKDGKIKFREDRVEGLENAPEAFIGMLNGKNFGKLVIKVGEDGTG